MTLTVQHVRLGYVSDRSGALIFDEDVLVGVTSQLSEEHGDRVGRWFLECGLSPGLEIRADFADLDELCVWVQARLKEGRGWDGRANGSNVVHFKPR
ncbi:MAG TPA: hypothetical protein VGO52_19790 [Hyphomonadaceae bacterium]|jgi:hypothetical protein|nr:hypothetical protein [Hyphomonadaceae bacterium]